MNIATLLQLCIRSTLQHAGIERICPSLPLQRSEIIISQRVDVKFFSHTSRSIMSKSFLDYKPCWHYGIRLGTHSSFPKWDNLQFDICFYIMTVGMYHNYTSAYYNEVVNWICEMHYLKENEMHKTPQKHTKINVASLGKLQYSIIHNVMYWLLVGWKGVWHIKLFSLRISRHWSHELTQYDVSVMYLLLYSFSSCG